MSSSPRIVTVVGATGNQGGSVARSLLGNKPGFHVRAITRNPESEASKELARLGAEIIKADGFKSEEIFQAFRGSWGAFVNLNSDDRIFATDGPSEFDLGKIIMDSAARAGVGHIVFSSGPPCSEMTDGKVRMKAMDMKHKIETYALSLGAFSTFTPICAGWYLENFLSKEAAPIFGGFPHHVDPDGYLTFKVPLWGGKEDVPWLSMTDDFGDLVHGILLAPERWHNKTVQGVSDIQSFDKMTASFQEVTNQKARWVPLMPSWEAFDTQGIHELEDVKLMFGFTQVTGGHYFGAEETENQTSAQLKEAAARARGAEGEELCLKIVGEWFKRAFSPAS